ncbi:hypothetical protein C9374_010322 [Naegleria lovaniensis]|uniref:Uncharacterized protein n=1 Tax=Naegleria lovaniensis TaxID=51637 RepID=A0AA88GGW1_NAELO|nr:uncharacterized protein C9374_010322 [Naegleria lovaniensis]KAG2374948.1 hypothetical protein C9374_010322 [Naegleria lovaniensis]
MGSASSSSFLSECSCRERVPNIDDLHWSEYSRLCAFCRREIARRKLLSNYSCFENSKRRASTGSSPPKTLTLISRSNEATAAYSSITSPTLNVSNSAPSSHVISSSSTAPISSIQHEVIHELKDQIPDTLFSSSTSHTNTNTRQYLTPTYQSPLFKKTNPKKQLKCSSSLLTVEMKAVDERDSLHSSMNAATRTSSSAIGTDALRIGASPYLKKENATPHSQPLRNRATLQATQTVPVVRKRNTVLQREEFSLPTSLHVKQPRDMRKFLSPLQRLHSSPPNNINFLDSPEKSPGTPPKITLNLGSAFPNHGRSDLPIYVIPPQSPPRECCSSHHSKKIQDHLTQLKQKAQKKKLKRTLVFN